MRRRSSASLNPVLAGFLAVAGGFGAAGCGDDDSNPLLEGPVTFLTVGNADGDDDDPAVDVDAQGRLHVVWFSDRDGTKDLYALTSTDLDFSTGTITWSPLVQITDNDASEFPPPTQGDNFPSLFIDESGTHHLAWHRWNLSNETHILYAKSDGTASGWAAAALESVTTGPNFDRFPNLVKFADNDLRIYFTSKTRGTPDQNDIFVARSTDNGNTWGVPTEVASLNIATEQTVFPTVVKGAGSFMATLVRWKLEPSSDFFDVTSDVFYAESVDGDAWVVEQVTSDPSDVENDLTPTLFFDHAATAYLAWATIGFGDPTADIVQMRVDDRDSYPNLVKTLSSAVGTPDHSPEVIPLTVDGHQVFVMVWVRIVTPPHNQVVYRMFSNL